MDEFKVGDMVRVSPNEVGVIYAVRPGQATGKLMHSIKIDKGEGKNPGHAFKYAEEITHVNEEDK